MHVLVTGGCGFIGSHLVEYHLSQGDKVSIVDDLSTGCLENIKPFQNQKNFFFEKADILTWPRLDEVVASVDRIYHMVAVVGIYRVLSDPMAVLNTNIMGCDRLLNAVVKSGNKPQILLASSSSVYGHSPMPLLAEENDLILKSIGHPLRNYALSKITAEALALAYHQMANIPVTIVRLFNTIGPRQTGQYGMVVPRFVQQALAQESLTVFGDGTQTRSFCDVRDIVAAILSLLALPESNGEIINVGNDNEITINELAEMTIRLAKSSSKITYVPYEEAYGQKLKDISQRRPDLTKLHQLIDFKHQWNLQKTLEDLIRASHA